MTIRVDQGKGAKDRYTQLSPRLLVELRRYWAAHRPQLMVISQATRDVEGPLLCRRQRSASSTPRRIAPASPSPAAFMGCAMPSPPICSRAGVDVHTIQRLLGHGSLGTTARYFHLAQKHLLSTASPLDLLERPLSQRRLSAHRGRPSAACGCGQKGILESTHLRASRRGVSCCAPFSCRCSIGRCAPSPPAAPKPSAVTSRNAMPAAHSATPTTPAAIGIARSARLSPRNAGSPPGAPNFCRAPVLPSCVHAAAQAQCARPG